MQTNLWQNTVFVVPIIEGKDKHLVGIITNRDLKFETDFTKKDKREHDHRESCYGP